MTMVYSHTRPKEKHKSIQRTHTLEYTARNEAKKKKMDRETRRVYKRALYKHTEKAQQRKGFDCG